ncbi:MAG: hypothetical protein R2882_07410 [Gemmatimonadales bacterium]
MPRPELPNVTVTGRRGGMYSRPGVCVATGPLTSEALAPTIGAG